MPLDPSEPTASQLARATAARAAFAWIDGQLVSAAPVVRRRANTPALVKLTSGSTATPRALPFTDAQMLADERQVFATTDIRATDLNLAVIPLGHSSGLGNLVVPLLAHLAPWKIPRHLLAVATFPPSARGKPDSTALRALLAR